MIQKIPQNLLMFGKELRKNSTPEEIKLWQHLKNKNLGFRFKRQVRIGSYIVDFSCFNKKLVIEVDGKYHKSRYSNNDREKTKYLNQEGYQILRFWNSEVNNNLEKVLTQIIASL